MSVPVSYLYNPQYFDVVVRATGLLSGKNRFERIKEVARKNIWLAAKCKNTCVAEEQEIVDWLILRCTSLYKKFNDIQAVIALMELKEWGVILSFFGIKNIPTEIWNDTLIAPIPTAFAAFSDYLPADMVSKLFVRLSELGYGMNLASYNAFISKMKSTDEVDSLLVEMSQQGITPDMTTYCLLLKKENDEHKRNLYCSLLRQIIDWEDDFHVCQWAYSFLITNCKTYEDVLYSFNEFLEHCDETKADKGILSIVYAKIIETAPTLSMAENWLNRFFQMIKGVKKKRTITPNPLLALFLSCTSSDEENNRMLTIAENIMSDKTRKIEIILMNKLLHDSRHAIIDSRIKNDSNIERLLRFLELFKYRSIGRNKPLSNYSSYYFALLPKANSEEDYVSILIHLPHIAPRTISELLKKASASQRIHLLHAVCRCEFETNIIHYNIVIKSLNYGDGFLLINEMIGKSIIPDNYTIQALLRKWMTVYELFNIIQLASYYGIPCDSYSSNAIFFRCQEIGAQNELFTAIDENRFDGISTIWIKQLRRIGKDIKSEM